jgi:flagellar biogenesis protein FliO
MRWNDEAKTGERAGLSGWLLGRLRSGGNKTPRLSLVDRIALAPRQSLALVEAEGRSFLVATSAEGAPAFYALDERRPRSAANATARATSALRPVARAAARVSW